IADVQRTRRSDYPFTESRAVGDDYVITRQVEALERQRVQQQERLVLAGDQRQPLHERSPHVDAADDRRHLLRPIHRRVHGRIGKQRVQLFQHALGAAVLVQVVVNQGKRGGRGRGGGGRYALSRRQYGGFAFPCPPPPPPPPPPHTPPPPTNPPPPPAPSPPPAPPPPH